MNALKTSASTLIVEIVGQAMHTIGIAAYAEESPYSLGMNLRDAYGAALRDAKAGDLVGPFQVEGGYAVVQVQDRRPQPPMSLDEARPQIVRFLTYDQVRDLLKQLRDKSPVKVLLAQAPAAPAPAPAVSSTPAKPEARP